MQNQRPLKQQCWTGVLVLFAWLSGGRVFSQETPLLISPEERARICSIFEVAYLNAIAIRSGDVLFEITDTIDTVKPRDAGEGMEGVFESSVTRCRCVFDIDKSRFAIFRQKGPNRRIDMGAPPAEQGDAENEYSAWAIDFPRKKFFLLGLEGPAPWRLTRDRPLGEVLRSFDYLDPRGFREGLSVGLIEDQEAGVRARASGKSLQKEERGGDRIKLVFFAGRYDAGDVRSTWEFDAGTSLPLRVDCESWFNGKFYPMPPGEIEWTDIDGQPVVRRTSNGSHRNVRSADGRDYLGLQEQVIEFHWFSVNQDVDEGYFDGSKLRSVADFRHLLEWPKSDSGKEKESSNRNTDSVLSK